MKVFFSGIDDGDYISSLISGLKKKHINVINGHDLFIQKRIPKGAIIHIHWPEMYYKKGLVNNDQVLNLYRSALQYYSQRNQILFSIHNLMPHDGHAGISHALYEETIRTAHQLIHLGPKSIDPVNKKYPIAGSKKHLVIPHHVLPIPKHIPTKMSARIQLGMPNDISIIASIGGLRYKADVKQMWQYFEDLKASKKVYLFIHKYRHLVNRYFLSNLFNYPKLTMKELKYRFFSKNVAIHTKSISLQTLCKYISASDFILLPRSKNQNSGVPFLVCNYHKPILTNAGGNIQWSLGQLGYKEANGIFMKEAKASFNAYNTSIFLKLKEAYLSRV